MTHSRGSGCGHWMSYVDAMMHEYHMTLAGVLHLPLAAGMTLAMPMRERHGIEDGNSHVDREVAKAMRAMGRMLRANYEIQS